MHPNTTLAIKEHHQVTEFTGPAAGWRVVVRPKAVDCSHQYGVRGSFDMRRNGVLALTDALEDVDYLRIHNLLKADSFGIDNAFSQLTANWHVGCCTASCSVE